MQFKKIYGFPKLFLNYPIPVRDKPRIKPLFFEAPNPWIAATCVKRDYMVFLMLYIIHVDISNYVAIESRGEEDVKRTKMGVR